MDGRGPVGSVLSSVASAGAKIASQAGLDPAPLSLFLRRGDHDTTNARALLEPMGISCPALATYLDALYSDYLERRKRSHK